MDGAPTEILENVDLRCREVSAHVADWLREVFHPAQDQVSCHLMPEGELAVSCAHLVDAAEVENYRKLGSLVAEQIEDCTFRMTGPWPPYHFLPATVRLPALAAPPIKFRSLALSR